MTGWEQLALLSVGTAISVTANLLISMYFYKWRKREDVPEELQKEIQQVSRDVVVLRGQIKYIQGILNGKFWKRQED